MRAPSTHAHSSPQSAQTPSSTASAASAAPSASSASTASAASSTSAAPSVSPVDIHSMDAAALVRLFKSAAADENALTAELRSTVTLTVTCNLLERYALIYEKLLTRARSDESATFDELKNVRKSFAEATAQLPSRPGKKRCPTAACSPDRGVHNIARGSGQVARVFA